MVGDDGAQRRGDGLIGDEVKHRDGLHVRMDKRDGEAAKEEHGGEEAGGDNARALGDGFAACSEALREAAGAEASSAGDALSQRRHRLVLAEQKDDEKNDSHCDESTEHPEHETAASLGCFDRGYAVFDGGGGESCLTELGV